MNCSSTPGANFSPKKATWEPFTANRSIHSQDETFSLTVDGNSNCSFLIQPSFSGPTSLSGPARPLTVDETHQSTVTAGDRLILTTLAFLVTSGNNSKQTRLCCKKHELKYLFRNGLLNQQVSKCSERKVILCVENAASDSGH